MVLDDEDRGHGLWPWKPAARRLLPFLRRKRRGVHSHSPRRRLSAASRLVSCAVTHCSCSSRFNDACGVVRDIVMRPRALVTVLGDMRACRQRGLGARREPFHVHNDYGREQGHPPTHYASLILRSLRCRTKSSHPLALCGELYLSDPSTSRPPK